jgi:hypothetical protein
MPEEISGILLFLASEMSGFATRAVFTVDAGQTAHEAGWAAPICRRAERTHVRRARALSRGRRILVQFA